MPSTYLLIFSAQQDGTTHVIWARGMDKLFSSKGLCLAGTSSQDHGFIRVRLLTPPALRKPNARQIRVTNKDFKVPGADTTYWCKVQKLPDFVLHKMHHIVEVKYNHKKEELGIFGIHIH